jgi:hypothetical protein
MQNLFNWVTAHPYKAGTLLCVMIIFAVSMWYFFASRAIPLEEEQLDDYESPEPAVQKERNYINIHAGCLGTCCVVYEYTPGIPTLSGHPIRFGEINLIRVKLSFGLTSSEDILPLLTFHQRDLLAQSVYKEHELRALLQN